MASVVEAPSFDESWKPRANEGLSVHSEGTEMVVLNRDEEQIHQLSETAAVIFSQCDGNRTPADLVNRLCEQFDVDPDQATRDVHQLLVELRMKKLID